MRAFLFKKFIGGEFKMEGVPQSIKLKKSNNSIEGITLSFKLFS